jgi:hypothetical protein
MLKRSWLSWTWHLPRVSRETVAIMAIRTVVASTLALVLVGGAAGPVSLGVLAQSTGQLAGTATDEAKEPYTNYVVRIRTTDSTTVLQTVPLTALGTFSFSGLTLSQPYMVELFQVQENKLICTEGTFELTSTSLIKNDVVIDCGTNPALWILAAGAGAAVAAASTQSGSE